MIYSSPPQPSYSTKLSQVTAIFQYLGHSGWPKLLGCLQYRPRQTPNADQNSWSTARPLPQSRLAGIWPISSILPETTTTESSPWTLQPRPLLLPPSIPFTSQNSTRTSICTPQITSHPRLTTICSSWTASTQTTRTMISSIQTRRIRSHRTVTGQMPPRRRLWDHHHTD